MAISEYKIGATLVGMVNVETLVSNMDPPHSYPEQFSVVFDRGDGGQAGHGFPETVWKWDVLTGAEVAALRAYCSGVQSAAVYIRTRKPDNPDTFDDYAAVMLWPRQLQGKIEPSGLYLNVEIVFRRLVEQ